MTLDEIIDASFEEGAQTYYTTSKQKTFLVIKHGHELDGKRVVHVGDAHDHPAQNGGPNARVREKRPDGSLGSEYRMHKKDLYTED